MKQTEKLLMTTMSTSLFNISESPSKISRRKKSGTPNLTPNRDLDKSRSITYRTNSNFIDILPSPTLSTIKRPDNSLHERLYNQAKEIKEKIDNKQNELLEQIKRESIPKIHEVSKKIERKQELFPERLYPYHKLNKLDTDEDNSFEYAHVATVRSNPLGISGEFDNDDFRNNIDSIFCDDEEIKNLYGNKPSFVKIYRGIKYPKKEKFSFQPTLNKNTYKIINNLDNSSNKISYKKCKSGSIDETQYRRSFNERDNVGLRNNEVENLNSNLFRITSRNSDSGINYNFNRVNNPNLSNYGANNNNLINIDFIYNESPNNNINNNFHTNTNFQNNNSNFNTISQNNNTNNIYMTNNYPYSVTNVNANLNFYSNTQNDNNPINYAGNNSAGNVQNFINQENNNINNQNPNNGSNNNNKIAKKSGPNYFDNPTDRIKSRYEMELKKSYTTNYYNANKNKNEKINQKSINISNKLYSQGINFIKKKEKINEEKQKADSEEYKKHSFKPNLNNSNSTNFANLNNVSSNLINYNSSNSSVYFASNNLSGINRNNNINNNFVESQIPNRNASIGKSNFKTNNSKNTQLTQNSNNSTSTHFTKIQSKGAYSRNKNSRENMHNFNNNNNNMNCNFSTNVNNNIYNLSSMNSNNTINSNNLVLNNFYNQNNNNQLLNNFTYSGEEYKAINQLSAMNISTNNINNSAVYTQLENRSSSAKFSKNNKFEREDSTDLTKSINSNFYEKCIKWKDNKDQKANKLREEKSKEELKKCSFSPKIIPKSKNFFDEKFTKNDNNMFKNDYVTRMMNVHNKKEQEKNFQSKIFGENSKNSKMKITQPQEFNFSQLVSRKCRENFNKAKVLHRAESVKNYRENLSTNIFFNQAVFEIEENINNNPNNETVNLNLNNNTVGAYEKLIHKKPESSQLVNKNMNINFNVNIMMNK